MTGAEEVRRVKGVESREVMGAEHAGLCGHCEDFSFRSV